MNKLELGGVGLHIHLRSSSVLTLLAFSLSDTANAVEKVNEHL